MQPLDRHARQFGDGQIDARVAMTVPWRDIAEALDALRQRSFSGKAVLTISD